MTDDELIEALGDGAVLHPKRWSGDTHFDLGGSIDEDSTDLLMRQGADRIAEAVRVAEAVDHVVQAITDEGSHPAHHRRTMRLHRQQWPTLWRALDDLRAVRRAILDGADIEVTP